MTVKPKPVYLVSPYDHFLLCLGCQEDMAVQHAASCPLYHRHQIPASVLLRLAAKHIRDCPRGIGHDIREAAFQARQQLLAAEYEVEDLEVAMAALADYLVANAGPGAESIRREIVYRHGLFVDISDIITSLYGAAAEYDAVPTCGHPTCMRDCRHRVPVQVDGRTCAFPGDQEHDHAMCEDVAAEEVEAAAGQWTVQWEVTHRHVATISAHRLAELAGCSVAALPALHIAGDLAARLDDALGALDGTGEAADSWESTTRDDIEAAPTGR